MSDNPITRKAKVLFVDDSKVNVMMGEKILTNLGLNVSTAENGQQAIDLCKTQTFQLILMDLEMPEVDGLAAAAIIRTEKLSFAPIFALTGTNSEEIRLLCRAAHMNGIIEKPLKKEKMLPLLNNLFG